MRTTKLLLICLLAGSAAQLAGCASMDTFDRPQGATVDDSALSTQVKSAIASDAGPAIAMNVNVTASEGMVLLTGFAESDLHALRAEQAARSIAGVRGVRNELNIPPRQRDLSSAKPTL